ncbi:hypothetical protein [Insolitispirillum peregrinum]
MSVLLNNPTILAAVVAGVAFLITLKVTAFLEHFQVDRLRSTARKMRP